ncbi:Putative niacin/nicotinamide transporter NaiP [Paraburkholderia aspalathi]|uniref:Niacin/nicotinamide transporter NaiP n=1 Tax=Paraburkholderia aspalathi TaxID=1324617 RepID=A0ABM8T127_9BURK|nr:MFS transporter [Paraburkholderia aspalathi]MBK3823371.1 MFS transporter [Paraburkholderia aspalathi]MBK3835208.1 MFS transporter [Paraburkholderia aspalathi]MBK3864941.1 MFS transporter [Paraburkholderia aspalathi]CAE6848392.1 Putative niacin/nicotinamide transporter NaiP [Paraburkholderia aspalathi]
MFTWYKQGTPLERNTFWGCFAGWGLDALDVQMFTLAIPAIIAAYGIDHTQAGAISSVTLISSALGGWIAGALSDRIGRVRTLQITILWFAGFTFLCAFAQNFPQLLVLKALQGFGFGGEWAAGAVLMAETIRTEHRGKAMGAVQSAWAVGWGAAVLVYAAAFSWLPSDTAWRVMFAVGLVPAGLVLFVRRNLKEPARVATASAAPKVSVLGQITQVFQPRVLRTTVIGAVLGTGAHGGYYAIMTWLPTFLAKERHLSVLNTGGYLAVVIVAFWCGCMASAYLLDRIGRRRNVALFAFCCIVTVLAYVMLPLSNTQMLVLGFPLGLFAAGIPASLGPLFNELYPADMRGTGVGFCYNFGRIASAGFPVLVGYMSHSMSLGMAIGIDAAIAYGLAMFAVLLLPETRGKRLRGVVPESAPDTVDNARLTLDPPRG